MSRFVCWGPGLPALECQRSEGTRATITHQVSSMWSIYVHAGSNGGDIVEAPLDHKVPLRPKGGWNDVRA